MDNFVPCKPKSSSQNWLMKTGSQSKTSVAGTPCKRMISLTNISATWDAVKLEVKPMKCACFDNQSTTTRIIVFLADVGRWVMKSSNAESQIFPGIERGCKRPWGEWLKDFTIWQTLHHWTKSRTNCLRCGQKKVAAMQCCVHQMPAWSPTGVLWNSLRSNTVKV